MIITLANGKGGSGKTTLAVLLAHALAESGKAVSVLDLDPQGTALPCEDFCTGSDFPASILSFAFAAIMGSSLSARSVCFALSASRRSARFLSKISE